MYTIWIQSRGPLIIKEMFEWGHLDGSVDCFTDRLLKLYLVGSYNVKELKWSKTGCLDEKYCVFSIFEFLLYPVTSGLGLFYSFFLDGKGWYICKLQCQGGPMFSKAKLFMLALGHQVLRHFALDFPMLQLHKFISYSPWEYVNWSLCHFRSGMLSGDESHLKSGQCAQWSMKLTTSNVLIWEVAVLFHWNNSPIDRFFLVNFDSYFRLPDLQVSPLSTLRSWEHVQHFINKPILFICGFS